jgi:hypothetical protein
MLVADDLADADDCELDGCHMSLPKSMIIAVINSRIARAGKRLPHFS